MIFSHFSPFCWLSICIYNIYTTPMHANYGFINYFLINIHPSLLRCNLKLLKTPIVIKMNMAFKDGPNLFNRIKVWGNSTMMIASIYMSCC